jgi:hypothetical protein
MHQEAPIIITREDELLVHNKVLFLSTCTEIQVAILVHHMVSFYRQKNPQNFWWYCIRLASPWKLKLAKVHSYD